MDHRRPTSTIADDIDEFDLLLEDDDIEAIETGARSGRMPRRGAAGSAAPTGASSPKRARLRVSPDWNRVAAALLVVAVAVFILYFMITSIMGSRREGAYKDYFRDVRALATTSEAQGTELDGILVDQDRGTTAERIAEIESLSGRAAKLAKQAEALETPEQLTEAQRWLTTSLTYRANGIDAVQRALGASIDTKDQGEAAEAVSAALSRLVAADVVWADSFKVESVSVLQKDDIEGVRVPDSTFAASTDGYGPKAVKNMLDRLGASSASAPAGEQADAPTDGKIRGGEVGAVMVAPSGQTLTPGALTEVTGGADVAFEVPFTNQGEVQLTEVPVKLTIRGEESDPITLTGVIDVVDPGEAATATISLDEPPNFGETLEWDVVVGPILGEKTADNNVSSGQIRFDLG